VFWLGVVFVGGLGFFVGCFWGGCFFWWFGEGVVGLREIPADFSFEVLSGSPPPLCRSPAFPVSVQLLCYGCIFSSPSFMCFGPGELSRLLSNA